jgi:hypothetical protein
MGIMLRLFRNIFTRVIGQGPLLRWSELARNKTGLGIDSGFVVRG